MSKTSKYSEIEKRKIIEEYQQENDPHYYGWGIPHENYKRRRPLTDKKKEYIQKELQKELNKAIEEADKVKNEDFVPPFRRK